MKSLFEKMSITYHQEGDYLLPNLVPPESIPIGIWGQRRRHYLKTQRGPIYNALLLSGKLASHLSEIDTQAETMFFQLVEQLAKQEGVTEQLKSQNQTEWVQRMNNVRNQTEEIICCKIFCKNRQNLVEQRITPHFLTANHPNYYGFTTKG